MELLEDRTVPTVTVSPMPPWNFEGPAPIIDEVNQQSTGFVQVGAVEAVAVNPDNPADVYLGAVNGGVWHSTNATDPGREVHWTPLTDQFPSLSISALSFSRLHPDGSPVTSNQPPTLWAGIGRSSSALDGGPQAGLLVTTDGGAHWSVRGQRTFAGADVSSVVPTTATTGVGQVLLVAASNGLFRSPDGGQSFGVGPVLSGDITDLIADPGDPHRFFAAKVGGSLLSSGVYRSDDDGQTWKPVLGPDHIPRPGFPDHTGIFSSPNIKLAIHGDPNFTSVYAGVVGDRNVFAAVFQSRDLGGHWVQLAPPGPNLGVSHFAIAADPVNPNQFYVAGDSRLMYRGDFEPPPPLRPFWVALPQGADGSPHEDHRRLVFDGAGVLLDADDGGVYRLTSARTPAGSPDFVDGTWASANGDLGVTEFYSVAYSHLQGTVLGAAQDTGVSAQPVGGDRAWFKLGGGDGGQVAVDESSTPGASVRYFLENNFGFFRRVVYTRTSGLARETSVPVLLASYPNGAKALGGLNAKDLAWSKTGSFERVPFVLNAADPSRLLLGRTGLYESFDKGNHVLSLSPVPGLTRVNALAYGGRTAGLDFPDVALAGLQYTDASGRPLTGLFLRTGPGLAAFHRTGYVGDVIRSIKPDPDNWHTVYVLDSRDTLWMGTRVGVRGEHWANVTGNLFTVVGDSSTSSFRSLEVAKINGATVLLVGARGGLYRSLDAATAAHSTWSRFGDGLPQVPVNDVHYDPQDDLLLVGTLGRGAWTVSRASASLTASAEVDVDDGDSNILLTRDPSDPLLDDLSVDGGTPVQFRPDVMQKVVINGGGNTLTIDVSWGNPLPAGELDFGGPSGQPRGQLVLRGGDPDQGTALRDEKNTALGAEDGVGFGTMTLDGKKLSYVNVASIEDSAAASSYAFVRNTLATGVTDITDTAPEGPSPLTITAPDGAFTPVAVNRKTIISYQNAAGVTADVRVHMISSPAFLKELAVSSGTLPANNVSVSATAAGVTTIVTNEVPGSDGDITVEVGDGALGNIQGDVVVEPDVGPSTIHLHVLDSADLSRHVEHPVTLDPGEGAFIDLKGLTPAPAVIEYAGPFVALTVDGGSADTTFDVNASGAKGTEIDTGLGTDTVHVTPASGMVKDLKGPLAVRHKDGGGRTDVIVHDANHPLPAHTVSNTYTITPAGMVIGDPVVVSYSNVQAVTLDGARSGRYRVTGRPAGTDVTVNAGAGLNTYTVTGAALRNGQFLDGFAFNGLRTWTLVIDDRNNKANATYRLTKTTVQVDGSAPVSFAGALGLTVRAGGGANTLDVARLPAPPADFDGGRGSNTLVGPDTAATWRLTGVNAGALGRLTFSGVSNLTGGSQADTFRLGSGRVTGAIDGGGGVNALDYSGFTGALLVDLPLGRATSAGGGIKNIRDVVGGLGNAVIVGDGGGTLIGGAGRDILIAGPTAATLLGGPGEDVLIGGATAYDRKLAALVALLAEWSRRDVPHAVRVNHLRHGGGLNGSVLLDVFTVHPNGGGNTLEGGGGLDLIFGSHAADASD